MFKAEPIKDTYKVHQASCPLCQSHNYCQVAHDILLKEAGYIPRKKEVAYEEKR